MERDLPKIDITENFVIGRDTDIGKEILELYTYYPCRLKAEVMVLCMGGEIEAVINLSEYHIKENDFITLLPGSIFQINKIKGEVKLYFLVFSSEFIKNANVFKTVMDFYFIAREHPVLSLHPKAASLYEEYFLLLIRGFCEQFIERNPEMVKYTLLAITYGLQELYKKNTWDAPVQNRSEEICKQFIGLLMQHYTQERNIAFYADRIGITTAHLSNTVKQVTKKTVIEIISEMVIMDAKAQLKSTKMPIKEIADSLNFTNMSFFGKYFKRYAGMGPQKYRDS